MNFLLITVAFFSCQPGCLANWNTSNAFMDFVNSTISDIVQILDFNETSGTATTEIETTKKTSMYTTSYASESASTVTSFTSTALETSSPATIVTTEDETHRQTTIEVTSEKTTGMSSEATTGSLSTMTTYLPETTTSSKTTNEVTTKIASTAPETTIEVSTKATTEVSTEKTTIVSPETTTEVATEKTTIVSPETTTEFSTEKTTEGSTETTTKVSPDTTTEVSVGTTTEISVGTTTEVSVGTTTEVSVGTTTEVSPKTTTEENTTSDSPETDTEVFTELFNITIEDTTEISPDVTTEEFPPAGGMSASEIAWTVIGSLAGVVLIILLAVWYLKSRKRKDNNECPIPLLPDGSEPEEAPPGDYLHPSTSEEQPRKNWAPLPPAPLTEDDTAKMFASDDTIMVINIDSPLFRINETNAEDEIDIYGNVTLSEKLRALTPFQYELGAEIRTGKFAVIKLATLKDTVPHQRVAAKMAKTGSLTDAVILRGKLNFLATEMTEHPNIVNFIAADLAVPMIFMDLCDGGSLTDWVQVIHFVTPAIKDAMMFFCYDIICGLEHLHGLKVLHRRLGIRNVLLGSSPERKIAKITGYGPLEKETDAEENDGEVPIRWLPPESLDRLPGKPRSYSEAVDMWSFGVTIWEIYSRAEQPFEGCDLPQLKEQLKKGDRLLKPRDCPKLLFESVVQPCWSFEPLIRPSAKHVHTALSKMKLSGTDIGTSSKSMTKEVTNLIKMHEYESRSSTVGDKDNTNLEVYEIMIDSEPEDYAKLNKLYQNEDKEGYTPLTQDMTNSEPEDYAKLNKLYQNEDNVGYTSLTQDTKDATVQEKDKNDASSSDDKPEEETYEYISIIF